MSFAYVAGIGAGSDDVYDAMYTTLLSQGWTVLDTLSTREVVWQSAELVTGTGYKLYFYIKSDSNQVLNYIMYNDWDIATHTGIQAANGYGNPRIIPWTGGPYRLRCNPYSIAMYTDNAAFHDQLGYIGLYQRAIGPTMAGFSPVVGTITAGATILPTVVSLVSLVQPGQQLLLWNWAHSSASANASNREVVTVASVTSVHVVITIGTTYNYDADAMLGQGTLICTGWGDQVTTASTYPNNGITSMGPLGYSGSPVVGTVLLAGTPNFESGTEAAIDAGMNLYPSVNCPIFTATGAVTTLGSAHHMIAVAAGSANTTQFTKFTDGTNVYEQVNQGVSTGGATNCCLGPTGDVPNFSTMLQINSPFPNPEDFLLVNPVTPTPPPTPGPPITPGSINGATINGYAYVGSGGGLTLGPIVANATALALPFSENIELLGPSSNFENWSIQNPGGGVPVVVYSVSVSGINVIVTTSGHTAGKLYQITIPQGIIGVVSGESYAAPATATYTGVGLGLAFTATPYDARTLFLVFNEPVMVDQALDPANYIINNGLNALSVTQNTTLQYTLITSEMTPGTIYTIVADVYSLNGN